MQRKAWYTLEFWATVLVAVGAWLAFYVEVLPADVAAIVAVVSGVCYAAARAITKYGGDLKRSYKTTEFYVALFNSLMVVLAAVPGELAATVAFAVEGLLVGALVLARAWSKPSEPIADILAEVERDGDES